MGAFSMFIGKLLSCCGLSIDEEELREPIIDGRQHIPDNLLSTDFYGRVIVPHPPSAISNRNLKNESYVPNKSRLESSSASSQGKASQFRSGISYDYYSSSKEVASDMLPSKISVSSPLSSSFTARTANAATVASSHGKNGSISAERDPLLDLLCSQKTPLVLQKVTSSIDQKPKEVKLPVPVTSTQKSQNLIPSKNPSSLVNESTHEYDLLQTATLTAFLSEFRDHLKSYDGSQSLQTATAKTKKDSKTMEMKIQDYTSSQKILLVGEGDFSFSACLAKAFVSATNMVATSLNSEDYLKRYYSDAMKNIFELRTRGCRVFHKVNAMYVSEHKSISSLSFDRIIYNFPHCGDFSSTIDALRKNQSLVRQFMRHSAKLLKEDGEIHIRHKSNYFFWLWNLKLLATQSGLVLIDVAPFDASKFSGYNTKYGFERGRFKSDNNFDCHSGCTYKFVLVK